MTNSRRLILLAAAIGGTYACVAATSDKRSDLAICTTDETGSGSGSGSCGCPVPAGQTLTDTLEIDAKATGTAAAGKYDRGGMELTTSAAALKRAQEHAKHYDGKTTFSATYTIVLDDKGVLDKAKSKVTFKTKTYLDRGTEQKSTFTTNEIGITDVTMTADCPPKVKSFKFSSSDWYPATETGAARLKDRTLSGSIDLAGGKASYTAKYADKTNGAIYTYQVEGTFGMPLPPPDDGGDAGTPDAGTPDAGSGSDAPPDAGTGSGTLPFVALDDIQEWLSPPDPSYELADAGTFCDDTMQCDFPDGLSCIAGYCQ